MIYRIVMAVLLPLVPAGGVAGEPSHENTPIVSPAKSEKEALLGLQSLRRVQLRIPGATESLRADAVKQLREQLPQLDTAGSADDWTLEFVFGRVNVGRAEMLRPVGPELLVEVRDCHCRVVRTVVVNERIATAVAYEGPSSTEEAPIMVTGHRFSLAKQSDPEGKQLLRKAITGFAAEWRRANPNSEHK
jgi:hypothetical protein